VYWHIPGSVFICVAARHADHLFFSGTRPNDERSGIREAEYFQEPESGESVRPVDMIETKISDAEMDFPVISAKNQKSARDTM